LRSEIETLSFKIHEVSAVRIRGGKCAARVLLLFPFLLSVLCMIHSNAPFNDGENASEERGSFPRWRRRRRRATGRDGMKKLARVIDLSSSPRRVSKRGFNIAKAFLDCLNARGREDAQETDFGPKSPEIFPSLISLSCSLVPPRSINASVLASQACRRFPRQ